MAYMSNNKVTQSAVRDSFDVDDLSDIDDEVFIRDGKNGILRIDDECRLKRPLMAPRRKFKNVHLSERASLPYRALFAPFCYGLIALFILFGLIALCALTVNLLPAPLTIFKKWISFDIKSSSNKTKIVPCTSLHSDIVWIKTFPKLTAEAPLRSMDVNGDGIEDLIVGFSTGLDTVDASDYFCTLYFNNQISCSGGVLALNGKTGDTIWTHWTKHAIFSVDCSLDLNGDSTKDCIISGRGGILEALNGLDGNNIWEMIRDKDKLEALEQNFLLDIYDAKFIADIDGDNVGDVVASHLLQINEKRLSEILIISGKSGNTISSVSLPETEELFIAPQILVHPDGENIFVIVTNSQKESGGLYVVPQNEIIQGEFKLVKLHHTAGKGILLSPILVDITQDGTEDIVAAMFNSTIVAYDGKSFQQIWNYTIPNSEVISIPIPGYYDDDEIPDFMVKHQFGTGFPIYSYTQATILNGKTGRPLLDNPMEDSMSAQMSGLSISVEGFGNDWFLYWSSDCRNHSIIRENYELIRDKNTNSPVQADLCKLRYNSTLTSTLYAFSQHVGPPGIPLYYSEDWKSIEFNNSFDPRKIAENYILSTNGNNNPSMKNRDKLSEQSSRIQNRIEEEEREINDDYKVENPSIIDFENKIPEEIKLIDELRGLDKLREELRPKKVYDVLYEDENEPSRFLQSEIRSQRSEKLSSRIINDTNDIQNKLDPSMDYTNGQTKRYYSLEPVNRTNSLDEDSEYFMPDLDFTDDSEGVMNFERKRAINADDKISFISRIQEGQKEVPIDIAIDNGKSIKLQKKEKKKDKISSEKVLINEKSRNSSLVKAKRIRKQIINKRSNLNMLKVDKDSEIFLTGVQKQSPTGILLPSQYSSKKQSIDLIFSTYWLPVTETPIVLLQRDLDCIKKKEAVLGRKLQISKNNIDDIIYVKECLGERGVNYKYLDEGSDRENEKIPFGQMTIYRMQLQCLCPGDIAPHESCKDISSRQNWPAHLGATGSGFF